MLKKIALDLDVMCVAFVKSEGTRFQNHKYRAIKALIVNYLPMSLLMENYIAAGSKFGDAQMRAKMTNWLELFRKFEFLASINFYYKTLKQTAHLAYSSVLITDTLDMI